MEADKLDKLAEFLDGFDDEAAEQARERARYIRAGLVHPADDLKDE